MKSFSFSLLAIFNILLSSESLTQSLQISHVPAEYFSLDKFVNEVYYIEFGTYNIYVKNLQDSTFRICPFPTLPIFANKSHKCVYGDEDSIFVYDFTTNKNLKICDSIGPYGVLSYAFSPNDDYVLFKNHYYSFLDSTLHEIYFTPDPDLQLEWMNEAEILFRTPGDEGIVLFDFLSNSLDTVLYSNSNMTYEAFAYNKKLNLLYYSQYQTNYPEIHAYDLMTQLDSLVFDSEADTNDGCWFDLNNIQEMEWSPDSSSMAFFSYILDAGGTIYTYVPEDKRVYKYTVCGGDGYEYHLKWLNNDTIVYFNATDGYIYGFVLDDPLGVGVINPSVVPSDFEITAYPNPFNGIVHFNISGKVEEPELRIYNISGEEIARIENLNRIRSNYTATWNGRNSYGIEVSSGVYFAILRDKKNPVTIKGTSKIMYLK